ncbi:hypothetical protein NC651_034404 [Populus alba x Populus x berolinensis]|nr:hypothetical protein NC651_034404 [Populus alba x Populus x berolinensis]
MSLSIIYTQIWFSRKGFPSQKGIFYSGAKQQRF